MSNTVSSLFVAGFAVVALVAIASAGEPASQPVSGDWPQWRGPNRDGVAPSSPKLLDSWPKDGPKLLWKSEMVPSGSCEGGYGCNVLPGEGLGSPVAAGGKVFLYVFWRMPASGNTYRFITDEVLKEYGWQEDVPADLAARIDETWLSGKNKTAKKPGPELDAFTREFLATLDPKVVEKHGDWIRKRIAAVSNAKANFTWPELVKWSKYRNKDFTSAREFMHTWWYGIRGSRGGDNPPGDAATGAILDKETTRTDTVICLDAATGKTLWRKSLPAQKVDNGYMDGYGLSSTVTVSGGKCYAVGSTGVYCLDVKDGSVVWQAKGKWSNSSPLVANGRVFYASPDLTAYDAETGRLLWKAPRMGGPYWGFPCASVVEWKSGGKSYLIGVSDGGFYCAEPETGKILWNVPDCKIGEGGSSAAIQDDIVAVQAMSDLRAYKITPQKAELLWQAKKAPGGRTGSPAIFQDRVYASSGAGTACFDLKTGEVKTARIDGGNSHSEGTEYSSLLIADEKIIMRVGDSHNTAFVRMLGTGSDKLDVLGFFPDPKTGGIVASCTSPAIADGKMYLRLLDCIACYDLRAEQK
jgi:outer membrane protein assembly factor BamB